MGGQGSGPQKSPSTLIKEAKEKDAKNLPYYFEKLSEVALKGDRESLVYLIDRHLGKPKQQTDIDITGGEQISTGLIVKLFRMMSDRKRLLEEGVTYERPSVTEGTDAEEGRALQE